MDVRDIQRLLAAAGLYKGAIDGDPGPFTMAAVAVSPRTALDLLARIQKHTAHAGKRSFHGLSKTTPEQLDLFDALSLPKPA
ncbi:peptidoglycan-binding protein [Cereibacter azotoformans]|nr:peptidoglycan-binding domain-containing protein [Cereibacter azotoformans]ULB10780.1 peptidoglycan-binding protein [Cereibacter azotoformans]